MINVSWQDIVVLVNQPKWVTFILIFVNSIDGEATMWLIFWGTKYILNKIEYTNDV